MILNFFCPVYIYVWKWNQTVLELDFGAVKFLFFPRRDLNPHQSAQRLSELAFIEFARGQNIVKLNYLKVYRNK
jgi:hypothetical protein